MPGMAHKIFEKNFEFKKIVYIYRYEQRALLYRPSVLDNVNDLTFKVGMVMP